jgi:hypothetical protein
MSNWFILLALVVTACFLCAYPTYLLDASSRHYNSKGDSETRLAADDNPRVNNDIT